MVKNDEQKRLSEVRCGRRFLSEIIFRDLLDYNLQPDAHMGVSSDSDGRVQENSD